ncbi:MAG: diguanylate cyclase, partial [Proteobacteria bacterium]|nr:diguanylate cyclase [Burkholderiales bacterium]
AADRPDGDGNVAAAGVAALELSGLRREAEEARAVLARLQQDVLAAEAHLGAVASAQLVAANESLVLAALDAHAEAEAATKAMLEASRAAGIDPLTQLPNRVLMLDRFTQAISHAKRHHSRIALLFLDLNDFKRINDTLGHAFGDRVLEMVAQRLAASVREADTVSRHGGDEFLILLTDVAQAADCGPIAQKIIDALAQPWRVGDHVLRLVASIGISIYPDDGGGPDVLIACADAAMYRAKRGGISAFAFHGEAIPNAPLLGLQAAGASRQPLIAFERAAGSAGAGERERQDAPLREANEKLLLAALDAQDLQATAERAFERQTEFLAVLAHELRNPLAPLRTAAALLGRVRLDEPQLSRMQGVIERQVGQMSRLVGDLLDLSRVRTGKLGLQRQPVAVAAIVENALDICRPAIDTRAQRLRVQLPERDVEVDGDAVRLTQILSNLLDNASKYTPNGGEISLSVVRMESAAVITVADNGIGMAAESLQYVFDPFTQNPNAIGFNSDGLGIGLTVVRELVEAHGGSVVATSAGIGLGSQFTVTLPLMEEA